MSYLDPKVTTLSRALRSFFGQFIASSDAQQAGKKFSIAVISEGITMLIEKLTTRMPI